jgi:hypothetical protein
MGHPFAQVETEVNDGLDHFLFQIDASINGNLPVKRPLIYTRDNVVPIHLNIFAPGGAEEVPNWLEGLPIIDPQETHECCDVILGVPFWFCLGGRTLHGKVLAQESECAESKRYPFLTSAAMTDDTHETSWPHGSPWRMRANICVGVVSNCRIKSVRHPPLKVVIVSLDNCINCACNKMLSCIITLCCS